MTDPLKDLEKEHSIPDLWKDFVARVVKEISNGNFELTDVGRNVSLQSTDLATVNSNNLRDYGCTLIPLLEQTWESSRTQWMGEYWEITMYSVSLKRWQYAPI